MHIFTPLWRRAHRPAAAGHFSAVPAALGAVRLSAVPNAPPARVSAKNAMPDAGKDTLNASAIAIPTSRDRAPHAACGFRGLRANNKAGLPARLFE